MVYHKPSFINYKRSYHSPFIWMYLMNRKTNRMQNIQIKYRSNYHHHHRQFSILPFKCGEIFYQLSVIYYYSISITVSEQINEEIYFNLTVIYLFQYLIEFNWNESWLFFHSMWTGKTLLLLIWTNARLNWCLYLILYHFYSVFSIDGSSNDEDDDVIQFN